MMSAISGVINLPPNEDGIGKMLASMARRGPDGNEIWQENRATLLYAYMSGANGGELQPAKLEWKGERYILVYEGELYNSKELCGSLVQLGHILSDNSDAELLLHAYAQWKDGMLQKLNGIFALAIWEVNAGRLFLARDRIGVKPLFYKIHCGGFLFASEIKTILAYPGVDAQLDADGIGQILLLGPGREPGSGVFRGIQEVEPGCWGLYENGRLKLSRYWKLTDREHTDDFETTAEKVRALVLDAVGRQMFSKEALGTFLSGGLDSSLISAICAAEMKGKEQQLDTFSVDYVDNDKFFQAGLFQPNSDPEYIRTMVDVLNSRQHWTVLSPEALVGAMEDSTIARDLPGMADVDASLNLFCNQVKSKVSVVLSGECADEIFGGYPWYRDPAIRNFDGFPWSQTIQERKNFLSPWLLEKINPEDFVAERYQQTLVNCDILPGTNALDRRIKQLVNLNFSWFMQTLLDRNDRMSAGHGLRVRVPLCDYRIAEYLYGVPWEMKNYGGREKGLLRYASRSLLPDKVLYRKKSPYPKTHHPQYLQLVSHLLKDLLQEKDAPIFQLVRREALESLLHTDFTWPWYGQLMRRPQTIVYMLQFNFWLKHYSVRIV